MKRSIFAAVLLAATTAWADRPAIDDARLGASAGEVRAVVDHATQAGLPAQLLVDKVREGLAKGVAPARIVGVGRALEGGLLRARSEAQPFAGSAPPPGLLRAIVEAHAVGAGAAEVATLLRAGGRERAVQVLTDLIQRGYPAAGAAATVAAVGGRTDALDRLVGAAERLRSIDGASPGEALDAIARANAQGLGLDHAEQLLHHAGDSSDDSMHGPNRETSGGRGPGSGGVAAPGHGKGRP
ncbi:MAG: hypothetical protein ACXVAN_15745 [Polyangia bacterium]